MSTSDTVQGSSAVTAYTALLKLTSSRWAARHTRSSFRVEKHYTVPNQFGP